MCDRFLADGEEVICLDNLVTGSTDNIAHLSGRKDFLFIFHDVTNYVYIDGPVDYVLHFASPASPPQYLARPIQTLKVGSLGTHKTLGLAKEKGARFLLASTSEIYGDPLEHPQKETYVGNVNPIGPRGVYDEAKRFAEAITMAYQRYHGVETRIARIFNTYGPRMDPDDGRVVSNFVTQALSDKPITIYGDGSQTRSFCYVSDLVEGIHALLFSEESEPVNLGNPDEWTISEFAELVKRLAGSSSSIERKQHPYAGADDPKRRRPDISKAKSVLGWEPEASLEQGLRDTIEYFSARK